MQFRVSLAVNLVWICLFLGLLSTQAQEGRVAIVTDGNYRDTDDMCATPVTLALIAATGNADRLVHYSHSCDLVPAKKDAGVGDEARREAAMQESCDGTAKLWGPFRGVRKYFNCMREKEAAVEDLAKAVSASSEESPLTIIEAGEPDIIYEAMLAAPVGARAHVKIVTHHKHNDRGDFHDLADIEALPGYRQENTLRIPNQNDQLKTPLKTWQWARDHESEKINWLWERGEKAQSKEWGYRGIIGDFDCSDAGMVYFWIFGEERPGVTDLRRVLTSEGKSD